MKYFALPGVKAKPSRICLGGSELGSRFTEAESFATLDAFAERGGTFVDTAHVYADWVPGGSGASERTIGKWLRSRGMRDRFVIGTKGGHPRLESMQISRLRPEDIARDISESLERLQVEAIDLYYLHRDDLAIPVEEMLDALEEQRVHGRIRALGASNWKTDRLREADKYARSCGRTGFVASQIAWSLAAKNGATDAIETGETVAMDSVGLDYYRTSELSLIPYSSQAGGFFARPYDSRRARDSAYHSPLNERRHARVSALAAARGMTPNALALAYLLNHPAGGQAVAGAHTVEQIADTCSAAAIELLPSELEFLKGANENDTGAGILLP
jgi:aryl-alcohol dehydrogenase-like predicted oxidoreductase